MTNLEARLVKELKGARLMLYAYRLARQEDHPAARPHRELDQTIMDIEEALEIAREEEAYA